MEQLIDQAAALRIDDVGGGGDKKEDDKALDTILKRLNKLEQSYYENELGINDEQVRRARHDVVLKKCYSSKWKWVPSNYYSKTLKERATLLGAPSTKHLCKAMVMENKSYDDTLVSKKSGDKTYSQFYLVVVQYDAVISNHSLNNEIRKLRSPQDNRGPPNAYNFSVAKEEDSDKLTGYIHNSVTPFGLAMSEQVPIVLSTALLNDCQDHPFMWMGGGHVHLKLGMSIEEFIQATQAIVADVSVPRTGDDQPMMDD